MEHAWIATTLFNIAAYAERNGLTQLHLDVCAAAATAVQGACDVGGEALGAQSTSSSTVVRIPWARAEKT
jgi:hypothetical protein